MASQVSFAHTANPGGRFFWRLDPMTKLARTVFAAAFILTSIPLAAPAQAHNCDALLDSQMAQCAGLAGVSYRNCSGHAMAVYTQCLTGAHF